MVRASLPPLSMQPCDHAQLVAHTSTRPSPATLLSTYVWPSRTVLLILWAVALHSRLYPPQPGDAGRDGPP